jgi:RNA polymerase sigma-70 factor, ECF subfamily
MSTATSSTARFQDIFPIAEHSEAALIQSFLDGNREAFAELMRSCGRKPYKAALALTKNPADAEDAVQDAQLRALTNLDRFRGESCFGTWLLRITINQALMLLRRKKSSSTMSFAMKEQVPNGEAVISQMIDHRETALEIVERQETQAILAKAIDELSPALRVVIVCRDIDGMSTEETGAFLALGESAVKSRLLRARLKMREKYRQALQRKATQE